MSGRRRGIVAGIVLAAAYLAVGALTLRITGHHVRPLFDSFANNQRYAYVCPPPELRVGNLVPVANRTTLALGPDGSVASTPSTDDGQMLFSLARGEVPPHGSDTSVLAVITPLCPSALGPVPTGFTPAGNAYKFTLTYEPSGAPVTTETKPGNVVIRPPTTADALLFSADGGRTWVTEPSFPSGSSLAASITQPGIYLAIRKGTGVGIHVSGGSGSSILPIVGGALAVVVVAGGVFFVLRRRR